MNSISLLSRLQRWARGRHRVYGINRRNVELVYAHNQRRHYPIVDDKLVCKQHMTERGIPVPDTIAVCEGLFAIAGIIDSLADRANFVVKPANGSGGEGILVVGERLEIGRWQGARKGDISAAALQRHLANTVFGTYSRQLEDRAFIEVRVEPHPVFFEMWRGGLCDVRVITLRGEPIVAMVRIPTSQSGGRANLHQGGLGLAVDLATGITERAVHGRRDVTHHPESGAPLLGIQLPDWSSLVDIARRAARAVPLGYLGVDIVVDVKRGPLVLELNARPGLEIQNVHETGLGTAIGEVF